MSASYLNFEITTLQSFLNYWKSKGMTLDKALAMLELEDLLNDEKNFPRSIEVFEVNLCECFFDEFLFLDYCDNCEGKGYTINFAYDEDNELYIDIENLISELPCDPSEFIKTHNKIITLREINIEYYY